MMRRQAAIFAIATAVFVPLGCARHEEPTRGLPLPAYQTAPREARELYERPESVATTESADAGTYDTGDYVPNTDITADRNGPDAETYGGAYIPEDYVVGGSSSLYGTHDYYYGHGYDPFYSEYPFGYGYPYGYYGGGYHSTFHGWYRGGHDDHGHNDDHDHGYYVRRENDVHVPRDRRDDGGRDRNVDRSPRESSPGVTDRQREEVRDSRDADRRSSRDASSAAAARQAQAQQTQHAREDRPRVEQNRTAADDVARSRAADRARADRSQAADRARDADRARAADAARSARNARDRSDPLPDANRRGGTDPRPARNDAPRHDQPSRGGTDGGRKR